MDNIRKEEESIELFENSGVTYLTKDDLQFLHDTEVEQFGGLYGVRDEALLDSVSKAPYQSVFGQDLYPSVFDKAAKYLYDFSTYQIFLDGNKRSGLCTAAMFLKMNGYELDMDFSQVYDLTMKVANGQIESIEEISSIFEEHAISKQNNLVIDDFEKEI